MRKRLKKKKRSCALCKPHKMGGAIRWKAKEFAEIKEFEKIKFFNQNSGRSWKKFKI